MNTKKRKYIRRQNKKRITKRKIRRKKQKGGNKKTNCENALIILTKNLDNTIKKKIYDKSGIKEDEQLKIFLNDYNSEVKRSELDHGITEFQKKLTKNFFDCILKEDDKLDTYNGMYLHL